MNAIAHSRLMALLTKREPKRVVKQLLTSFVANALTPGCKVQGLPHSQLSLMQVVLVHICCCVHSLELIKALAIVCNAALHLSQRQR